MKLFQNLTGGFRGDNLKISKEISFGGIKLCENVSKRTS